MTRRGAFGLLLAGAFLVGALIVGFAIQPVMARFRGPPNVVSPAGNVEGTPGAGSTPTVVYPISVPSLATPIDRPDVAYGVSLLLTENRRLDGEPPLRRTLALDVLAHERSGQLIASGAFGHCTGDEIQRDACPRTGLAVLGLMTPASGWGEVLEWVWVDATGDEARDINWGWLQSPPHRSILLDPAFHSVGVSVACCSGGGVYVVAVAEFAD